MSAKWMRVETDFVDHPKVRRLAAILNDPLAGWYILRTWAFVSRFCPTGQIWDIDGTTLETSCEWRGERGKLLEVLVQIGILDALKDGGWEAHNWTEHQGRVAVRASKDRERKRAYREKLSRTCPTIVPRDNDWDNSGRPALRDVTLRDVTGRDVSIKDPGIAALMEAWNSITTPPIARWLAGREKQALAALKRRPLEQWREVFAKIQASAFCRGESEAGRWVATIDWAIRPAGKDSEPALKVLEGAFDGAPSKPTQPAFVSIEHKPSKIYR